MECPLPVNMFVKIKIRRGLKVDLPDLTESEFGFVTDTGEVFIGAPDFPPLANKGHGEPQEQYPYKNIQLITNAGNQSSQIKFTYTSNGTIVPQTGPSSTQPVIRSYQERLNENVYFNDFRTVYTDGDISVDLNRALRQVYNDGGTSERKILNFSSGTLVINQPIKLPPFAYLRGEGIDRTFLNHTNTDNVTGPAYLFETVDKKFQETLQISTNSGGFPTNIIIEDMTITIPRLMDFFRLYRASNITFRRVKFKGAGAVTSTTSVIVFDRLGIVMNMNNFRFTECVFEDVSNIVNPLFGTTNIVSDIVFDRCLVDRAFSAMRINQAPVRNISWTNCTFRGIQDDLFELIAGANFSSSNNFYDMPTLTAPLTPTYISPGFVDYSSFHDSFNLSTGIRSHINESKTSVIVSKNQRAMIFRDKEYSEVFNQEILPNQTDMNFGPTFAMLKYNSVVLDYTVKRNGGIKIGTLRLTHDGTNVFIYDTYNETGSPDITFSSIVGSVDGQNHMILRYSTGSGSINGTLHLSFTAMIE